MTDRLEDDRCMPGNLAGLPTIRADCPILRQPVRERGSTLSAAWDTGLGIIALIQHFNG